MNCYRSARLFSSNPYVWEMSCGWWLKEWHHGSGGRNELLVCGHHGTIAIYTGSWDMPDLLQFSPECSISLPQQLRATVACKNEARGPGLTHCFSTSQWASWWSFLGGRSQHKLERLCLWTGFGMSAEELKGIWRALNWHCHSVSGIPE